MTFCGNSTDCRTILTYGQMSMQPPGCFVTFDILPSVVALRIVAVSARLSALPAAASQEFTPALSVAHYGVARCEASLTKTKCLRTSDMR